MSVPLCVERLFSSEVVMIDVEGGCWCAGLAAVWGRERRVCSPPELRDGGGHVEVLFSPQQSEKIAPYHSVHKTGQVRRVRKKSTSLSDHVD